MKKNILLTLSFLCFNNSYAHGENLKNPWAYQPYTSNLIDLKTSTCSLSYNLNSDLEISQGIYSDSKGSILDDQKIKYVDSKTHEYRRIIQLLVTQSNIYIKNKNSSIAQCVSNQLLIMAKNNFLAGNILGYQAQYSRVWYLSSISLIWMKIQTDKSISKMDKDKINLWLDNVASSVTDYFKKNNDPKNSFKLNNINYWAALSVMSTGIAINKDKYFNWGYKTLLLSVNNINNDGYLPVALERGSKALHYHIFSLQPLVTMAELSYINGHNVYTLNDNALVRLIHTTLNSMNDNSQINALSNTKQVSLKVDKPYLGFLKTFAIRENDKLVLKMLNKFPSESYLYLGGGPLPNLK